MIKWLVTLIFILFTIGDTSINAPFENYLQKIEGTDIGIEMTAVPAAGEEGIAPFWMGTYEITWAQYELFLFREIDQYSNERVNSDIKINVDGVSGATTPYIDMSYGMGKVNSPVVNVTQYAASTFCKWLSAKTGRFYRLATEAEWEYACAGGSSKKYAFGNNAKMLSDYAWYDQNSEEKYHPVGEKKPNQYGLYDMHGNVAEWVNDDLKNSQPLYPRTTKGGSWKHDSKELMTSAKLLSKKSWKKLDPQLPKSLWWHTNAPFIGFRIVRPLEVPKNYENWWLAPIKDY